MARNEEKSHSMLNRWLQLERGGPPKEKVKRPYLVELCHDIQDAQRWRLQVLREIGKNVLAIQNGTNQICDFANPSQPVLKNTNYVI